MLWNYFGALARISGKIPGALTDENYFQMILVIISPGGGGNSIRVPGLRHWGGMIPVVRQHFLHVFPQVFRGRLQVQSEEPISNIKVP